MHPDARRLRRAGWTATSRPGAVQRCRRHRRPLQRGRDLQPGPADRPSSTGREAVMQGLAGVGSYEPELAVGGGVRAAGHRGPGLRRRWAPRATSATNGVREDFSNIFVCRFDDEGRCSELREWWMLSSQSRSSRIEGLRMTRTILVVDDEPTLRETLAEALEQDGLRCRHGRRRQGSPRGGSAAVDSRPDAARSDAAAGQRHRGLSHRSPRILAAHHHAHGQGRRDRQGRGPGAGRR